jgi:hypothetical protein
MTTATEIELAVYEAMGELGQVMSLRKVTRGSVNPGNPGAAVTETTEDIAARGHLIGVTEKYQLPAQTVQAEEIAVVSLYGLTPTQRAAAAVGHRLAADSEVWSIVRSDPIEAGGVAVSAVLYLRRYS